MSNFFIKEKKEFLVTYATDFAGFLGIKQIEEFFTTGRNAGLWSYIISKEKGHEKGDIHDHFHVYLRYIGSNTRGFTCRGKNACRVWDVKLLSNVGCYVNMEGQKVYGLPELMPVEDFDLVDFAHPNIKFKGDKLDENCKNTITMIQYVTKEPIEIKSNFNWKKELENHKKNIEEREKSKKRKMVTEEEEEFCIWLGDIIRTNKGITKKEVKNKIMEVEKYSVIYLSKHYNYKGVLDDFFRHKPTIKPDPYWGIFWVPVELYDYLLYLDRWVQIWHDPSIKPKPSRPVGLYISGPAKTGKTALLASIGDFCYWCGIWNMDNYEALPSYNFFDDFDGSFDYKGNQMNNNFALMKGWFGGQQVVSISGKYKMPDTVPNGRPIVFVSNYHFEERFPNEEDKKYIRSCCKVIDLNSNDDLRKKPNTNTIGGFAKWRMFDTRDTWWYKNKILPNLPQPEIIEDEASTSTNNTNVIELSSTLDVVDLTQDDENGVSLIKSEDEDDDFVPRANAYTLGRPKKRRKVSKNKKGKGINRRY